MLIQLSLIVSARQTNKPGAVQKRDTFPPTEESFQCLS